MVEPYLNQVGGKVDDDVSLFTGGLNTYTDKAFLESNQMPYVMNMTMENPPQLKTRKGRTTIAEYLEDSVWPYNIGKIIDIYAYDSRQFFVIAEQNGVRYIKRFYDERLGDSKYTISNVEDSGGDPIIVPNEDKYYFTIARTGTQNYLYITGLSFKICVGIQYENPLSVIGDKIEDGYYGICCCHKGRMFLGKPGDNIVTFSAVRDYDNFAEMKQYQVVTNNLNMVDEEIVYLMQDNVNTYLWETWEWDEAQSTFVNTGTIAKTKLIIDTTTGLSLPDYSVIAGDFSITNADGNLVALKSFDDKLMIFCEHSIHILYGDTPDVSMQNQFQLVDLNNNLGAVSDRCIAIGGGRLCWLGDDNEVYEYTGSAINIISRPGKTRNSTLSIGGISGVIRATDVFDIAATSLTKSKFVATSTKLYINAYNPLRGVRQEKLLYVFDFFNRVWWVEDGDFNIIGNYAQESDEILIGLSNGDILRNRVGSRAGVDTVYDFETNSTKEVDIEYEINTRVYGADGTDLRKTLNDVWFQARAEAEVYINDIWTSLDRWAGTMTTDYNLIKIGSLTYEYQAPTQSARYRPDTYEQQVCYVEKMYGQRLNTFQIVIKGKGASKFYLMKREWRAR